MPSWPTSLPAPAVPGYGVDPVDQTLRTDMEVGAARVRRRTRARNDTVEVSWIFSDAQMAVFRAWFDDETLGASGGAGWFTVDLPCGDGGIDSVEARFDGGFKSKLKNGGLCWQVTAKLELRATALTADQRLAVILGLVVDGVFPSLVLPFSDTKALDSRVTFTRASTATYFDANGVMQTAAADVPRFDHDPATGESLGLLIEEARTNLLTYSEQFDNAAWTKGGLISAGMSNVATAPDGTLTADRMVPTAVAETHTLSQIKSVVAGQAYTQSIYVKVAGYTFLQIAPSTGFNALYQNFDLQNGVLGSGDVGAGNARIESVGGGWYRCTVTATANATGNGWMIISVISTASAGRLIGFTGDGTSGLYVWGAQFEAGSFPTSYIPTTTAAATRAVDAAPMTGTSFSSWFNTTEGTLLADFTPRGINAASSANVAASINDGTLANYLRISSNGPSAYGWRATVSSVEVASLTAASVLGQQLRVAGAYKLNDYAASINGAAALTDAAATVPACTQMQIGTLLTGREVNGHIKRLAYYPQRLTNAQLQAITA